MQKKQAVKPKQAPPARDVASRKELKKIEQKLVKSRVKQIPSLAPAYERAIRKKFHSLLYLACLADPCAANACRMPDDMTTQHTGLITPVETGTIGTVAGSTTLGFSIWPSYGDVLFSDNTAGPSTFVSWGAAGQTALAGGRQFLSNSTLGSTVVGASRCVGVAFELKSLEPPLTAQGTFTMCLIPGYQGGFGGLTSASAMSQYPGAIVATMSEMLTNGGVFRGFLTQAATQYVSAGYTQIDVPYDPTWFRPVASFATETMPRVAVRVDGLAPNVAAVNRFQLKIWACYEFTAQSAVLMAAIGSGGNIRPPLEATQGVEDISGGLGDQFRGVVSTSSAQVAPTAVYKALINQDEMPAGEGGFLSDWAANLKDGLKPIMGASKGIFDALKWGGHEALENLPLGDIADQALGAAADYLPTLLA